MNIVIIMLNHGRGSGEVCRAHARHCGVAGHRVTFMHPHLTDDEISETGGARCINIDLKNPITPVHEYLPSAKDTQKAVSTMGYDEAMEFMPAYEAALEAAAGDADIIYGNHANLSAIATARVARRHGIPYVIFVHGTGIEPRHHGGYDDKVWALIQDALEGADGLLVTTEYVRDELVRPLVDVPEERFLVLPCGVNLEALKPGAEGTIREKYNLPERFVICPGALTGIKGPQNVVEAAREFADDAPIIFIGDGELRAELEKRLGNRGRFLGFVPTTDKEQLIVAAALLTAAPEKFEHFGIIYAEALAAGTPVVAYTGGGVPSVVTPDVGILTERTPEALGKALRSLLGQPEKIQTMSVSARIRAEQKYAYPALVARLEAWFKHIVSKT